MNREITGQGSLSDSLQRGFAPLHSRFFDTLPLGLRRVGTVAALVLLPAIAGAWLVPAYLAATAERLESTVGGAALPASSAGARGWVVQVPAAPFLSDDHT